MEHGKDGGKSLEYPVNIIDAIGARTDLSPQERNDSLRKIEKLLRRGVCVMPPVYLGRVGEGEQVAVPYVRVVIPSDPETECFLDLKHGILGYVGSTDGIRHRIPEEQEDVLFPPATSYGK